MGEKQVNGKGKRKEEKIILRLSHKTFLTI